MPPGSGTTLISRKRFAPGKAAALKSRFTVKIPFVTGTPEKVGVNLCAAGQRIEEFELKNVVAVGGRAAVGEFTLISELRRLRQRDVCAQHEKRHEEKALRLASDSITHLLLLPSFL